MSRSGSEKSEESMVSPVQTVAQDLGRLREITSVLTRHGFHALARSAGLERFVDGDDEPELVQFEGDDVDEPEELLPDQDRTETAERFRHVLEDLGTTYIKLGQILSTRPDILPAEFIEELKQLQDRVPAMPFEEVEEQLESQLPDGVDEHFEHVQRDPLAAASIGQVHRARMADGTPCVIKVQRPGIEEKIRSDLDILFLLARFLEATIEEVELYTPTAIVEEFQQAILQELDFQKEAANIRTFGQNFEEVDKVTVPEVYQDVTTSKLLTLEYVEAAKLNDIEGGSERAERVLDTLLDAMVKMVLYDGFFHGDPHPGNILVREDNTLVFLDFGLVGSLSSSQQTDLIDLILTIIAGDEDGMARTLLRMGHPVGRVNLRAFKSDIMRLRDEYLFNNLGDIDVSKFVQEAMDAAQRHRIRLNPNYARLTKAAMTIEGIMRDLVPDLDILATGMPYAKQLASRRFSAQNIMKSAVTSAMGFSGFVQQVPQQLDQILMDLEGGNLEIAVQNESLDELGTSMNILGTRLFLGMVASACAIASTLLLRGYELSVYGVPLKVAFGVVLGVSALFFFWWALGWHLFGSGRRSKIRLTPLLRLFRRD
jgi:ubiquinone biosynthesis protein